MKHLIIILLLLCSSICSSQDSTLVLSYEMFNERGAINLGKKETWLFKAGRDSSYTNANSKEWIKLKPAEINENLADENGRLEGWFRINIKLDRTFKDSLAGLNFSHLSWTPIDLFINGNLVNSYGSTGLNGKTFEPYKYNNKTYSFVNFETDKTYNILLFVSDKTNMFDGKLIANRENLSNFILLGNSKIGSKDSDQSSSIFFSTLLGLLTLLFWALYFQNNREKQLLYPTITIFLMFLASSTVLLVNLWALIPFSLFLVIIAIASLSAFGFIFSIPLTLAIIFKNTIPKTIWMASGIFFTLSAISVLFLTGIGSISLASGIVYVVIVLVYYLLRSWKTLQGPKRAFVIGIGILLILALAIIVLLYLVGERAIDTINFIQPFTLLSLPLSLFVYILLWLKESRKEKEKTADDLIKITQEKKDLLENQNIVLEQQVNERTAELNQSLEHLKATQSQLIQSEKMASLGELTAGIAHEIQNPLNFVNNFSEVSQELIDEMNEELEKGEREEVKAISVDIKQNLEKIAHHGKRADSIVKGMLQHSRSSNGKKEATNVNTLADEYLRLAYHGLRAKDKSFNATLVTNFDKTIVNIEIIPQDIGRVILNLVTNAFYAVYEKMKSDTKEYEPTVTVSTKKREYAIEINVTDNGNGIPEKVLDKIFQPFFTTKPTGEGTGLGLSMSYDIITKGHGGKIKVKTEKNKGTTFKIELPYSNHTK